MRTLRVYIPPITFWLLGTVIISLAAGGNGKTPKTTSAVPDTTISTEGTVVSRESAFDLPVVNYEARLKLVFDMPLFSETRQGTLLSDSPEPIVPQEAPLQPQPKDEPVALADAPPVPPALEILGYMVSDRQMRVLVSLQGTAEEQWVAAGDRVLDWDVANVSETTIRIRQGEFEHIVEKAQ